MKTQIEIEAATRGRFAPGVQYKRLRRRLGRWKRTMQRKTQWVVFEQNGEELWAAVRRTIEDFLLAKWRSGGLVGSKPEEAFFVKCDRTTMTQADLESGRLVCIVGVAPLRPAEFVLFRIGQWTADHQ